MVKEELVEILAFFDIIKDEYKDLLEYLKLEWFQKDNPQEKTVHPNYTKEDIANRMMVDLDRIAIFIYDNTKKY